jgi:hypothetical protein
MTSGSFMQFRGKKPVSLPLRTGSFGYSRCSGSFSSAGEDARASFLPPRDPLA